jgi:hypothetical protein
MSEERRERGREERWLLTPDQLKALIDYHQY